jgi:hypothetical protein
MGLDHAIKKLPIIEIRTLKTKKVSVNPEVILK